MFLSVVHFLFELYFQALLLNLLAPNMFEENAEHKNYNIGNLKIIR